MKDLFDGTFFKFLISFVGVILIGLFILGLIEAGYNASVVPPVGKFCQKGSMCTDA